MAQEKAASVVPARFGILDRGLAEGLITVFHNDAKEADSLQLKQWRRKNFGWEFLERFALSFDKQD